jgi:phospholipid-transporting ATPase
MEFLKFSTLQQSYDFSSNLDEGAYEVLLHIALCHSIIVDPRTNEYNSSSPDELALVNGAKKLGFEFLHTDYDKKTTIMTPTGIREFKLLQTLEFSSSRRRMSVVVKDFQSN